MLGIYCFENLKNGKLYIGQSRNIVKRKREHLYTLRKNTHRNKRFQNDWNKYGEENFSFNILLSIKDANCLDEWERYFILLNQSNKKELGYNQNTGGQGGTINDEVKKKIALTHRGLKSELNYEDVVKIKMAMWCGISRRELVDIYGVSDKVLGAIARGANFDYVLSELNNEICNFKQRMIDIRNQEILKAYEEIRSVRKTSQLLGYSESIVEKCVYKYTNDRLSSRYSQQKVYDEVMRLYHEGYEVPEIIKQFNIPPTTTYKYVKNICSPYNVPSCKKIKECERQIIIDMYEANTPVKEIAKKFKVTRNSIESIINNYKYANTELTVESKEPTGV